MESDSAGNTTLKVDNNRTYAMYLTPSGLAVQPVDPLDAKVVDHAIAQVLSIGGKIVLPPGAHLSFLLDSHSASGRLSFRPDPIATMGVIVADVVAELADPKFATAKSIAIMDCLRELGDADNLDQINDAVNHCTYHVL